MNHHPASLTTLKITCSDQDEKRGQYIYIYIYLRMQGFQAPTLTWVTPVVTLNQYHILCPAP